jgi:hypothetical protein
LSQNGNSGKGVESQLNWAAGPTELFQQRKQMDKLHEVPVLCDLTDEELHARHVFTGDQQAAEILFERYFNKLCRFVSSAFPSLINDIEEIASDAVQAVLMRVKQFEGEKAIRSFVFTVARNKSISRLRKRAPTISIDAPSEQGPLGNLKFGNCLANFGGLR